jgi:hypothetical protein
MGVERLIAHLAQPDNHPDRVTHASGLVVPSDYDAGPERYRLGLQVAGAYATESLYDGVAAHDR